MNRALSVLFKYERFLSQLWLVLALAVPVALSAQDAPVENETLTSTEQCDPEPTPDNDVNSMGQGALNIQAKACEQRPEMTIEARQEMATEISEDTHNSYTLRRLLLGQNYVFFGRAELDYALYSGDIPSSENGGEYGAFGLESPG